MFDDPAFPFNPYRSIMLGASAVIIVWHTAGAPAAPKARAHHSDRVLCRHDGGAGSWWHSMPYGSRRRELDGTYMSAFSAISARSCEPILAWSTDWWWYASIVLEPQAD